MTKTVGRRTRSVSIVLLASLVLGACTSAPSGAGGGAQTKGGVSGKPELAAVSIGTALVIRDLLSPTLSYSGNVQARTQVNLVPKISGRLERLTADVGDDVKAGQLIAELDHAQLDAQVIQAEAAVSSAQAKLEQTQSSAKQEDIDAAQAAVDQAAVRLAQARAGGRPEEIAVARSQADQAAVKAEQVAAGAREEDVEGLQAGIDQAEAQQEQLRAQLTAAQTGLTEARYRLEQARAGQGGPGVRPEDIAQAQATLDSNRARVAQLKNPRVEDIRIAEADVREARALVEAAESARDKCGESTTTRTRNTQRAPVTLTPSVPGGKPKTENRTTETETTSTQRQSCSSSEEDRLESSVDAASASLQGTEATLAKVRTPNQYEVAQAEQAVILAEANVQKLRFGGTSDLASLDLRVSQTQSEADRLQAALDQSSATATAARTKLQVAVNPSEYDVRQAQEAATQARANVARVANSDPYVVQTAAAGLDQAQATLGSRLRPFTEQDIRVSAAAVEQAAAALEITKVQASEAFVLSPFDAVVSQKLLSPGAMAAPQTPILALVSRDVEIVVQVEEARIGQIARGQTAELTVSAFPGRVILGIVQSVAPSADVRSRTFPARIVPREQDGSLRDGMFAQVNIVGVGQQSLLIPNEAIVTRAGRTQIFVVVNDQAVAREVRLGETDGRRTAILEGNLNQGDEVVVTNPEALSDGAPVVVEQRNIQPGAGSSLQPSNPRQGPAGGPGLAPGGQAVPQGGAQPGVLPGPGSGASGTQSGSQSGGQGAGSPAGGQSGGTPKP